jgi:Kef-type K+ transport system membrane component KefB
MTPIVAHADSLGRVLLALALVLLFAKLGGYIAERMGQPSVLGELVVGVLLGNLSIAGIESLEWITSDATLSLLANLGAVILLFEVGLESTLRDMLKVGPRSLVVAVLGVVAPWLLGWWVGALFLPDRSVYVHIFLGAILTATSVGITARVLKDLGRSQTPEARIILGAAVIDDVLGLVILAVVGSVIAAANVGQAMSLGSAAFVLAEAVVFLFGALAIGTLASPRLFRLASRLPGTGALLTTALVCCFALASLASAIGLAPIVGAYAAGLILEETHYREFTERGEHRLEELVRPISILLVPLFFVLMGMRVDLHAFARPGAIWLAALLTVAAILGKQVCALGGLGSTLDKITIGIGMIPRGEVGLIFANIGLGLVVHGERIVDDHIYSAVVIAIMVTTLVPTPALKGRLSRTSRSVQSV